MLSAWWALAQPAQPVGSGSVAPADVPVAAPEMVPGPGPGPGAACPLDGCCTKKICVPYTDKKVTPKPVYCCKCVDFCVPRCNPWSLLRGKGCCDCETDQTCCKLYTKRVLVKRICEEEECVTKCRVEEVPACCAPACKIKGGCLPPDCVTTGPVETVPLPKK